jgi:hypothetical protein
VIPLSHLLSLSFSSCTKSHCSSSRRVPLDLHIRQSYKTNNGTRATNVDSRSRIWGRKEGNAKEVYPNRIKKKSQKYLTLTLVKRTARTRAYLWLTSPPPPPSGGTDPTTVREEALSSREQVEPSHHHDNVSHRAACGLKAPPQDRSTAARSPSGERAHRRRGLRRRRHSFSGRHGWLLPCCAGF